MIEERCKTQKQTSPWCEKYRPTHFNNIVLDPMNRIIFNNIIERNRFPHLLFYGPPGAGKTTCAENLIHAYQSLYYRRNKETVIHLNASDERGIEVIRTQIHQFVKSKNMFEDGLKFVILDEVDYMTKTAQQALKNLLQSSSSNVRFCLICNYICKIDDSLKNEFICIRFNQLPQNEIIRFVRDIANKEKLPLDDETIQVIQKMYHSDIRSMVNFLQLHQNDPRMKDYLYDNILWEELRDLFHFHGKARNYKPIFEWITQITNRSCNIDVKTFIKRYLNYIIRMHPKDVSHKMLNIAETIVHQIDTKIEYSLQYFVHQFCEMV
jgi:replication factor C subunit 3/5